MKRICILISILLLLNGCTASYLKEDVDSRYNKLNNKFDKLVDDVIKEPNRKSLEEDFASFIDGMKKYREEVVGTQYLDEYIFKSQVKLQNLKDLKD